MKKLIILSIVTACCISFAQGLKSTELSKRAIVGFEHNQSRKQILIFEINTQAQAQEILGKGVESLKKKRPVLNSNGTVMESIGGGWQPEISDLASAVGGFINEVSTNLGEGCNALKVATYIQYAPVEMNTNVEIDITQLSEHAQICLRK